MRRRGRAASGAHAELEPRNVAGHIFAHGVVEVEVDGLAGVAMQMLHPACGVSSTRQRAERAGTGSMGRARPGEPASTATKGSLL